MVEERYPATPREHRRDAECGEMRARLRRRFLAAKGSLPTGEVKRD